MKTLVRWTIVLLVLVAAVIAYVTKHKDMANANDHQPTNCPVSPGYFEKTQPVEALVNSSVTLPCVPKATLTKDFDLEWSKGEDEILTLRGLKDTEGPYNARASFVKGASLLLHSVTESDSGEYCCCVLDSDRQRKCTNQTLIVKNTMGDLNDNTGAMKDRTTPAPVGAGVYVGAGAGVVVAVFFVGLGVVLSRKKKSSEPRAEPVNNMEMQPLSRRYDDGNVTDNEQAAADEELHPA